MAYLPQRGAEEAAEQPAWLRQELNAGEFRTGENIWLALGLGSLLFSSVLVLALMDWRLDDTAHVWERALPGTKLPTETNYLTFSAPLGMGEVSVELKVLEWFALSLAGTAFLACAAMCLAGK